MTLFSNFKQRIHLFYAGCLLAASVFLSGCASGSFTSILGANDNADWNTLYLRGSFTWWEAEAKYQVKKVSQGLYKSSVELVADNQPYDFKFADVHWTPGTRCGYRSKEQDEVVMLEKIVKANCDTAADNFKFTPPTSGLYHFYFDVRDIGKLGPQIFIEKAKD